ncbi:putative membrane protein [Achromobacter phage Mano]|uniref:Putative membrane protein n=1 Tax=Achromobacter phage Mano TaxID=2767570 RepID=A0A7L8G7T4_9CAUD|nr:hypothetical protein KB680_gp34 [Achromobacter phage Mano]QOE32789.1 putative membrane protein [Achromobacter phage Mano]
MEQKHLDYLAQLGPIMPADVKPELPGWYARGYPTSSRTGETWLLARDYWDGTNWFMGNSDGSKHESPDTTQPLRWRGLAEPTISAPAIADAMTADAAALGFVDVVQVGPDGAKRGEAVKVAQPAPDARHILVADEFGPLPVLKRWQVCAIVVAAVALISGIAALVN